MISIKTVKLIREKTLKMSMSDFAKICDLYGERREEIFGYIMSFRQVLELNAVNDLLMFFIFISLCFEEEYGMKFFPTRKTIEQESKKVRDKVQYLITSEPNAIGEVFNLWSEGVVEKNLYAHGIMDVMKKYDATTENGIQVYIGIVSLIEILSHTKNC